MGARCERRYCLAVGVTLQAYKMVLMMCNIVNGFLHLLNIYLSLFIWQYAKRHSTGNRSSNVEL